MIKSFKKKIGISCNDKCEEDKSSNKKALDKTKNYPAAGVLLDIILNEYKNEIDRGRSFDTRSGIFLPFIGAIIIFLPELISGIKWEQTKYTIIEIAPYMLIVILTLVSLVLLLFSCTNFIKVLKSKEYERIKYYKLDRKIAKYPEDSMKVKLVEEYIKILDTNIKTNNEKAKYYKNAMTQVQQALFVITSIIAMGMFVK